MPSAPSAHIIKFPSGKFGYTGKVPVHLAFEYESVADLETARQHGPGLAMKIAKREGRVFRTRAWNTEEAAREAGQATT